MVYGVFQNNCIFVFSMNKKLTILAALLLFCIPLRAQFYLGGAASVAHSGSYKSLSTSLRPDVGYSFGQLSVGVAVVFETYRSSPDENSTTSFGLSPYLQYYVWSSGNFSLYLEGGIGYYRFNSFSPEDSFARWAPYLAPGISFAVTEHWSLEGQLGRLEYNSHLRNTEFSWMGDDVRVGLYYTF